jgi:hypothetical protein
MADGCIHQSGRKQSPVVSLILSAKDVAHVHAFALFAGSGHAVRSSTTVGRGCVYGRASLRFASSRIVTSLARFGVVPRKSLTAKVIGLEQDRHFWRGVVDGDGFVGFHTGHGRLYPRLALVGAEPLLLQFAAFVRSVSSGCRASVVRKGRIWTIDLIGKHAAATVSDLYRECSVALPRKLGRAVQIMQGAQ